ncbi:MAG: hypothetical protein LBG27_12280 [Spirochaetaceae bacterium]|jgi:hypothetical protein|nr:hypothetical protein [Spirochaetaceae bacterium]
MKNALVVLLVFLALPPGAAETVKGAAAGRLVVDTSGDKTLTAVFSENHVVILDLDGDTRFLRGLEIELTTVQNTFAQNAFALSFYRDIKEIGEDEWEGTPVYTENLAGKIATVYQVPFRPNSGFRRTPYVSLLPEPIEETAFPVLLRIIPAKAPAEEIALFHLSVKPVPGDEGAVKLTLRYPQLLRDKPVSVLVDDEVVENVADPQFLQEGEHQLLIISEDYRTESRRFLVDRGKTTEISITLKDTMPLLLFEAPDRALIFINNKRITTTSAPYPIAPGTYDIKIQVSDYTIIKTVQIQKGKTYRVAFTIDMSVSETD